MYLWFESEVFIENRKWVSQGCGRFFPFTMANPGRSLCFNTHWSAPSVFALVHSGGLRMISKSPVSRDWFPSKIKNETRTKPAKTRLEGPPATASALAPSPLKGQIQPPKKAKYVWNRDHPPKKGCIMINS